MSYDPVRVGLIGAGAIAQTYAQAFRVCEQVQLVGVADVRAEAARSMADAFQCEAFDSPQALADVDCEAVILCTPPVTHASLCEWYLGRGIHVLCEKPLAPSMADAERIVAAARNASVLLTMASKFRFVDDVIRAKSLVESGLIGEVILFENAFTSRVDMSRRWNSVPEISGGGVLMDNGTHSVDIMRYFLGPLAEIQVIEGKRVQPIAVEDTVRAYVRSVDGVMGSIDLSWSLNKELSDFIRIYGSAGTVSVGWKESKYRRSTDTDWTVFGSGYDKVQAFSAQLRNFANAVRGSEPLAITLTDALASVEVIDAAYRAMRGAKWQAVERSLTAAA
jgi:predicted dehydrogenase